MEGVVYMKITKDSIIGAGKIVGVAVFYGLAYAATKVSVNDVIDMVRYKGNVKYGDAVDVIMSSSMYSSDKNKALLALKKDKDSDYYRAVIRVVKSNMFSSDKIKTITDLNGEEAE